MRNIRIDYYSGTGGSEWVAKLLADKLKLIYDTKKNQLALDSIGALRDEFLFNYYCFY